MRIRKKSGEAEGWRVVMCLVTCTAFDEDNHPQDVRKGQEYYVQGDCDPAIFKVEDGKYIPEPFMPEEEEDE